MKAEGKEYDLEWDTSCESRAINRWEDFMDFLNTEIIYPREEYRQLPEPTGGHD